MKQYGLCKINKNEFYHGFRWPLENGEVVTAPDWNPNSDCGGGLYTLPNAQGDYDLLFGNHWVVVEYDSETLVMVGDGIGKVPSCKIVYLSESPDGLLEYFKDIKFDNRSAYGWAKYIGDREYMKQFVTESKWAYCWARDIGDRKYMCQFVTDSEWLYQWAKDLTYEAIYYRI